MPTFAGAGWTETAAGFCARAALTLTALTCGLTVPTGTALAVAADGFTAAFSVTAGVCATVILDMSNKNARFRFIGSCLCPWPDLQLPAQCRGCRMWSQRT